MKVKMGTVIHQIKRLNIMYSKFGDLDSVDNEAINKKAAKYHEELSMFDENVFVHACNQWITDNNDKMPTIAHLRLKCLKLTKETQRGIIFSDSAPGQLICEHKAYFMKKGLEQTLDEEECCFLPSIEHIKELIEFHGHRELKSLQDNAEFCKKHYGYVLCDFHRALAKARRNPESGDSFWCRQIVADRQRLVADRQRYKNK